MRGLDIQQQELFSYKTLEERVPADHPLRLVLVVVNGILTSMDAEFDRLYSAIGQPSIPPERLLRASLLQISTPYAVSGSSRSNWTSICCSAGSWGWGWTRPY